MKIHLGDKVKSEVTGFTGIVTAICEHLYGETSYAVTSKWTVDSAAQTEWFVALELEVIE